ncbi:hypothetical protein D9M68_628270 [compost metagenome]
MKGRAGSGYVAWTAPRCLGEQAFPPIANSAGPPWHRGNDQASIVRRSDSVTAAEETHGNVPGLDHPGRPVFNSLNC